MNFYRFIHLLCASVLLNVLPLEGVAQDSADGFPSGVDRSAYRRPAAGEVPQRLADKMTPEQMPRITELGRNLFFDPRLSRSGLMSCATCHNPGLQWTDGLRVSIENSSRRTMSLFNLAWDKRFLWNGSQNSLAGQILQPLHAPLGMNSDGKLINERLQKIPYYRDAFAELLPPILGPQTEITAIAVVMALEFYVSTIVSPPAPFDEWVAGKADALTPEQKRGFSLFTGKARCSECHAGWRFSDGEVYDIGIKEVRPAGRVMYSNLDTSKAVGLRNIALRPPYFHNGTVDTLEEVIDFYDRAGDVERPTRSDKITRLELTADEKRDLRLFLDSLSGPMPQVTIPILPR